MAYVIDNSFHLMRNIMASSIFSFFLSCLLSVGISVILLSCAGINPETEINSINLMACVIVYLYLICSLHKKIYFFINGFFNG